MRVQGGFGDYRPYRQIDGFQRHLDDDLQIERSGDRFWRSHKTCQRLIVVTAAGIPAARRAG